MTNLIPPKISTLPPAILRQLVTRFETAHKTGHTFSDHENWLAELGHPIKRTSIWKFCVHLRKIKAANPDTDLITAYLAETEKRKKRL